MKKLAAVIVIAIAAGAAATTAPLSPQVQNTLTTIDEVPTQTQVTSAFGSGSDATTMATMGLISIAQDTSSDVGVRLRAIRALAGFCPAPCDMTPPHNTLLAILGMPTATGADIMILRAALETLGQLKVQADLGSITPFLDHPSRDVRATAALALRDLCNTNATQALRTRLQHEATAQVQLAISSALRVLGQTPLACSGP
jgi:HEAT repeat protein